MMNVRSLYFVSAAAGAVVGAFVTYILTKKSVDAKVNEEVESIKQAYQRKDIPKEEVVEESTVEELTKKYDTTDKVTARPKKSSAPVRISPNEFGDEEGYECITLLYYKDGVLAYDDDEIIDDPDDIVGEDFYKHFGEYDDGTVYVRNDKEKKYYEICENELYYETAVKQSIRGGVDD